MAPDYTAVIFDMDGVIADSEPVYHDAVNAVLEPLGKHVSDELKQAITGYGVEATWHALAEELMLDGPLEGHIAEYDRELCRRLAELHDTLPGVRELILSLKAMEAPIGLASSAWTGWIDALLSGVGLFSAFDAIASATEVKDPKPAPDIYLLAARKLGVPPEQCIAIEDTTTGLVSAKAAGMLAVQVRAASSAFEPDENADIVLQSLRDFDLSLLGA